MKRIVGLFPGLLGVGGVQEAGRQTAVALDQIATRHGWVTKFLSLNDAAGDHLMKCGDRQLEFAGFVRAKLKFARAAVRESRKHGRIVIATHPHLALPAVLAKLISPKIKTIVMSHGVEVWQRLPLLRRRALLHANVLLAPSRYTANKLSTAQGVPVDRIHRLAWPLDPAFLLMSNSASAFPAPRGFPDGTIVLTVGRWAASERYKGADELIRAIARLRSTISDLHLVAVGGGDDLPRLRLLANELGMGNSVHFFDGLCREEIAGCYARATVFALPSTGEGFGLVFLEAMAFGKAIVAAASGGTTDLVEHEANGLLVPPHDPQRLADAIARLLRDDSLRLELGRRGAEIVREKYQFDAFQSELERVLVECGLAERAMA
ncbi:MAG: glycosyltransferase family 4 protein [Candidatus Acidiferrales bacterium]